jgi:site-specific DNA recombinase
MPDTRTRAVIYACYSTDMQNPMSTRDQLAACQARALQKGWTVVGEYSDAAISGTQNDRPSYNQMFPELEKGSFDILLSESLDRLSRDAEDIAKLYKHTEFQDVLIHTLDIGDVSETDKGLAGLMSGLYIKSLAAKTHRGLLGKINEGKSAGGLSYGYRVALDDRGVAIKGEQAIDKAEAEVVRRIFRDFTNGISPLKIAATLNDEKVLSPRSRVGSGGHWKQNTINGNRHRGTGILNNELYVGKRVWNRLKYTKDPTTRKRVSRLRDVSEWEVHGVPHLRFIDDELWDAVKTRQATLTKSRPDSGSETKNRLGQNQTLRRQKYSLSGLLECGLCGGNLTIARVGERKRYYCANKKEKGDSVCTGIVGILRVNAEALVFAAMRRELMTDDAYGKFREDFEKHFEASQSDAKNDYELRTRTIRQQETKRTNLFSALESGVHSPALIERLNDVDRELNELIVAREASVVQPVSLPANLPTLYRHYGSELVQTLTSEKVVGRAIDEIRQIIERITVKYDKDTKSHTLEIFGNLVEMLSKSNLPEFEVYQNSGSSIKLVAGVGFEPTTFRL